MFAMGRRGGWSQENEEIGGSGIWGVINLSSNLVQIKQDMVISDM